MARTLPDGNTSRPLGNQPESFAFLIGASKRHLRVGQLIASWAGYRRLNSPKPLQRRETPVAIGHPSMKCRLYLVLCSVKEGGRQRSSLALSRRLAMSPTSSICPAATAITNS